MLLLNTLSEKEPAPSGAYLDSCLAKIAAGQKTGLSELYRETSSSVYGYALSILKNTYDAEDAMHDCYISIYQGAQNYHSDGKPMAWILTITRNICIQKLREKNRTMDLPEEDWDRQIGGDDTLSVEQKLLLDTCMRILTDEERQILILHAVAGFKHREISALTGLGLSTVLSKYNRAAKKLKKELEKEE